MIWWNFPIRLFLPVLLCCSLSVTILWAQQLGGVVHDRKTGTPIRGASIDISGMRTLTSANGRFSFPNVTNFPITITASHIGYDSVSLKLYTPPDTLLHIYLLGKIIGLDEVIVVGKRNSMQDSLQMRQEFAEQFSFKPVKPWEALSLSPVGISINLNLLFSLFHANSSKASD